MKQKNKKRDLNFKMKQNHRCRFLAFNKNHYNCVVDSTSYGIEQDSIEK